MDSDLPHLTRPALRWMPSFIAALHEGYSRDTNRAEDPAEIARIEADPDGFIAALLGPPPATITLPDGTVAPRVAETLLWYVEGDDFIGSISIRHSLTPYLARFGGHIGYVVRPSRRRQGHAMRILTSGLARARDEIGLARVLLTVKSGNIASRKVIIAHGGVFADAEPHPHAPGEMLERHWIGL